MRTDVLVRSSIGKEVNTASPISVTAHAFLTSPVSCIPESRKDAPLRVPRNDAEDTWCLFLVPQPSGPTDTEEKNTGNWAIAESIGKWDMRWG